MKQRMITLALVAACIVLGAISFFVYAGQDRKAPEIQIKKKEITYTEGDDYDVLMNGVSAKDNIDGDLTKEIFVDKIVPLEDDKAIVYYGVMDSSHNAATVSRMITYIAKDSSDMENAGDGQEAAEQEDAEQASTEQGEPVKESSEEELAPNGASPAMAMAASEATVKVGETFDPLSVIAGVVDDVDDVNTLYQHIHVEGQYNTGVAGKYELRYYVSDSNGNTSEPHIFTLTVE